MLTRRRTGYSATGERQIIGDSVAREMHEAEGYVPVRFSWRMEIDLEEAPTALALPEGIELRPFDEQAHAQLVYEAHEEAFSKNWGHAFIPFEERLAIIDEIVKPGFAKISAE